MMDEHTNTCKCRCPCHSRPNNTNPVPIPPPPSPVLHVEEPLLIDMNPSSPSPPPPPQQFQNPPYQQQHQLHHCQKGARMSESPCDDTRKSSDVAASAMKTPPDAATTKRPTYPHPAHHHPFGEEWSGFPRHSGCGTGATSHNPNNPFIIKTPAPATGPVATTPKATKAISKSFLHVKNMVKSMTAKWETLCDPQASGGHPSPSFSSTNPFRPAPQCKPKNKKEIPTLPPPLAPCRKSGGSLASTYSLGSVNNIAGKEVDRAVDKAEAKLNGEGEKTEEVDWNCLRKESESGEQPPQNDMEQAEKQVEELIIDEEPKGEEDYVCCCDDEVETDEGDTVCCAKATEECLPEQDEEQKQQTFRSEIHMNLVQPELKLDSHFELEGKDEDEEVIPQEVPEHKERNSKDNCKLDLGPFPPTPPPFPEEEFIEENRVDAVHTTKSKKGSKSSNCGSKEPLPSLTETVAEKGEKKDAYIALISPKPYVNSQSMTKKETSSVCRKNEAKSGFNLNIKITPTCYKAELELNNEIQRRECQQLPDILEGISFDYDSVEMTPPLIQTELIGRSLSVSNIISAKQDDKLIPINKKKLDRATSTPSFADLCWIGSFPTCHKCRKIVDTSAPDERYSMGKDFILLEEEGSVWHAACFKCGSCSKRLSIDPSDLDKFFLREEDREPSCVEHAYENNRIKDFAKQGRFPTCSKCWKPIHDQSYTKAAGCAWHDTHFTCQGCQGNLRNSNFVLTRQYSTAWGDGIMPLGVILPYCVPCHVKLFPKKCRSCLQLILPEQPYFSRKEYGQGGGDDISASLYWHSTPSCFFCSGCEGSLSGRTVFYKIGDSRRLFCNRYCALNCKY